MVLNVEIKALSPIELLKSVRSIWREWKYKTPYQKWCYLYSFGRISFALADLPLFRNDQKLHWYSYFAFAYIGFYGICVIYTAYYFISLGEFMKILPSTCLFIVVTTVSIQNDVQIKFISFAGFECLTHQFQCRTLKFLFYICELF